MVFSFIVLGCLLPVAAGSDGRVGAAPLLPAVEVSNETELQGLQSRGSGNDFLAIPIEGDPITGSLAGLTKPWRIVLQSGDRVSLDASDLIAIRRKGPLTTGSITGPYIVLANGDRIRATAHFASQEMLRVNSELLGILEIPLERVRGIVLGTASDAATRDRLDKILNGETRKQDLLVLSNGDESTGTFTGLDDESIKIDRQGGAVTIPRNSVRAISFSPDLISFPKIHEFYAVMILADGTELSVLDAELNGGNIRGRTAFGRDFTVRHEQLVACEFRNGRVTYLSDLEAIDFKHTPYLGLTFPFVRDHSILGGSLSLRGQIFRKGIAMHSRSELSYQLDREFHQFDALTGIDDETAGQGSVVFRVLLDGREAWQSGLVTGQSPAKRVHLDVSEATRMTLIVEFGSLGDVQDHADWVDARLVR